MELYYFLYWFSGVAFATYMIGAIRLYHDRNMYKAPKRAYVAAACLMVFLAALTVRDVFVSHSTPFYLAHGVQADVVANLFAAPMTIFVVMELSHYRFVTAGTVFRHLLPFAIMAGMYVLALYFNHYSSKWIFTVYIIYTIAYVLYYIIVLKRAVYVFENELHNTYANNEGRALNWFMPLVVFMLVLLFMFTLLLLVFDNEDAIIYCDITALIFWGLIAAHVHRMRESSLIPVQEIDRERTDESSSEVEPETLKANGSDAVVEIPDDFMSTLNTVLTEGALLYKDDLSREDVAKAMGINHITMTRTLKQATGMTFSEFVCDRRLVHASHLLKDTNDGIEQILYSCGFRSRTTFHRTFTKKFHCSPTDYRQAHLIKRKPGDYEFQ